MIIELLEVKYSLQGNIRFADVTFYRIDLQGSKIRPLPMYPEFYPVKD